MANTPNYNITYPALTDSPNGPAQVQDLALDVDSALLAVYNTVQTNIATAQAEAAKIGAEVLSLSASVGSSNWLTGGAKVMTGLTGTFAAVAGAKYSVFFDGCVATDGTPGGASGMQTLDLAGGAVTIGSGVNGTKVVSTPAASTFYPISVLGKFTAVSTGTYGVGVVGYQVINAGNRNLTADGVNNLSRLLVVRTG